MTGLRGLLAFTLLLGSTTAHADTCPAAGVGILPLLAGDGRLPASYLVFIDGRARAAVNVGPGSAVALRDEAALETLFLTDLHSEQTSDLPALVAHWHRTRHRPLTVYGPGGSRIMPSTTTFVRTLFDGTRGAFRYLGDVVNPLVHEGFRLHAHDMARRRAPLRPGTAEVDPAPVIWRSDDLEVHAVHTGSAGLPSLAFRIDKRQQRIVVLDSARQRSDDLGKMLADAGLVVATLQATAPDGPYLSAATVAALVKGSRVRMLAFAAYDQAGATAVLEGAIGQAAAPLAARRCWAPEPAEKR